jgi:hypothetical protein
MRFLEIVAIVGCLVVDMATPLCSGAFRLDPGPSTSIEAVRARTAALRVDGLHRNPSPLPGGAPARARWARPPGPRGGARSVRVSALRGLPRGALAAAPVDRAGPPRPEDG